MIHPRQTGRYGAAVNGMDAVSTLGDNVPDGTKVADNRDNPRWLVNGTHISFCIEDTLFTEMGGHYFGK